MEYILFNKKYEKKKRNWFHTKLLIFSHRWRQFNHLRNENQLIKRIYMMTGKPLLGMACCTVCNLCESNRCDTCYLGKSKAV